MEQLIQIDPATLSPNVIYIALLFGLWAGITAFYIPGTGIVEVIALVILIGVLVIMTALPVNWVAVFFVVLGVAVFLMIPLIKPSLARYAELGLLLQAFGGYTLYDSGQVSPLLIAATVVLAWLYNRYLLVPILESHQEDVSLDDDNLVGMQGRVVQKIDPAGTVHVNGELWTARSRDMLESGVEITVVEKRGLELLVEKAKRHTPEQEKAQ